jgi:hypothetical protein
MWDSWNRFRSSGLLTPSSSSQPSARFCLSSLILITDVYVSQVFSATQVVPFPEVFTTLPLLLSTPRRAKHNFITNVYVSQVVSAAQVVSFPQVYQDHPPPPRHASACHISSCSSGLFFPSWALYSYPLPSHFPLPEPCVSSHFPLPEPCVSSPFPLPEPCVSWPFPLPSSPLRLS